MPLYEDVVRAVREAHGLDEPAFVAHLGTLVPSLHELRASYRSGWGSVAVTYDRAVTEAYLLAYYPHYVGLARKALDSLPRGALADRDRMRVCAFACGPAPEPVAVGQYLTQMRYAADTLALALYDIVPDKWDWARAVSIERVLPSHWHGGVHVVDTNRVDITAPGFVGEVAERIALADLILFQNCLNEFPADQAHVRANAEALLEAMKPGAVLLMADINNYPTGRACLEVFAEAATERSEILHSPQVVLSVPPAAHRPVILNTNFFVGGEYPRTQPFAFRCLAARTQR